MKIGYRRLDGGTSTAYLDCDHNNQHFTCGHGADQPHVGTDKHTDDPVAVMWNNTEWTEVTTGYNPAHYRAEGDWENTGAIIYCTQCTGTAAEVFVIGPNADDPNDPQDLHTIINATRQHHDDHHEGK